MSANENFTAWSHLGVEPDYIEDCNNSLTLKNPIMELKIDIPNGYEIDTEKSTLGHLILKEIKKTPKWEDFGEVKGWYVDTYCEVEDIGKETADNTNVNTFPSREEAEACLALSQLLQWRDKYNEGWKADYNNLDIKHGIVIDDGKIKVNVYSTMSRVLIFKNSDIAEKFINDFRDLIEIAKPLL